MDYSLSAEDISNICGFEVPTYSSVELQDPSIESIDDLFEDKPACLILYQHSDNNDGSVYGHWCCMFRHDNKHDTISFFDSYGTFPDEEMDTMIPKKYKVMTNQYIKKINHLLQKSKYKNMYYNEFKLQKKDPRVTTCGRHCAMYIVGNMEKKTLPKEYKKMLDKIKKKYKLKNYDEVVIKLTED